MFARIKKYFLSGLVVFLPVALTTFLFVWALNFLDEALSKFIEPAFEHVFGFYFWGLGIIVGLALIFLIGFFVANYFGKKLYNLVERILLKFPFFKQVYPAFKEIAAFLFSHQRTSFKQVVMLEYPRKGVYQLGLLTSDTSKRLHQYIRTETCNIFIPSVPSPLTGFVVLVPKKDITFTDISVEEAIKFFVSGGVLNLDQIKEKSEE